MRIYGKKIQLNIFVQNIVRFLVYNCEFLKFATLEVNRYNFLLAECIDEDSAVLCGEQLLNAMCKKRKGVLSRCVSLVTQILNEPNSTPQQKDGALHMIGAIADVLLKKDLYKDQFDDVLIRFVFPSMSSPFPFLRFAMRCLNLMEIELVFINFVYSIKGLVLLGYCAS